MKNVFDKPISELDMAKDQISKLRACEQQLLKLKKEEKNLIWDRMFKNYRTMTKDAIHE